MLDLAAVQPCAIDLLGGLTAHALAVAAFAGHHQRAGQYRVGVGIKAEIRVHQPGRHTAAVGVHILPDTGAHTAGVVAVSLVDGRVVTEQPEERREQTGRPHFLYKIAFAIIINDQLGGGRGPHHLHAAGTCLPEVAVHGLIAGRGHQRQFLGAAGGMVADRPGAQTVGGQRHAQLQVKGVVDVYQVDHIQLRGDADLHLAGRFQRYAVLFCGKTKVLAILQNGHVPRRLHLAHDVLHLGKGDGFAARVGDEMLHRQPDGQLALRLAARLQVGG